ncbi:hypothetical protein QYE76_059865 [Lolium multiflorum]|uniref:TF-B3 domain-containing protein n=1 Tax=Lolium multiflorum TaxID=4521 RepID=A0AAD8S051_LOLMU|nr:hypothetical protein QYE76_059865 [Lolium multiflorum]
MHHGMNWDRLHLPQRFTSIVDGQEPHHVLMRVSGGATVMWLAEVMFDGEGHMFLHNGWRCFTRSHAIEARHFVISKCDGHDEFSVKVFDETMCRCHYTPTRMTRRRKNENDVVFYYVLLLSSLLYQFASNGPASSSWRRRFRLDTSSEELVSSSSLVGAFAFARRRVVSLFLLFLLLSLLLLLLLSLFLELLLGLLGLFVLLVVIIPFLAGRRRGIVAAGRCSSVPPMTPSRRFPLADRVRWPRDITHGDRGW